MLVEHDGLDSRPLAWRGTATDNMLIERPLGSMLEEIATQFLDRALASAPGRTAAGKEVLGLLEHLTRKGFVAGFCGSLNPPQPQGRGVGDLGGGGEREFRKLIAQVPPLNQPAAQEVEQGGRTVRMVANSPIRSSYEKGDAVFSFAPPGAPTPWSRARRKGTQRRQLSADWRDGPRRSPGRIRPVRRTAGPAEAHRQAAGALPQALQGVSPLDSRGFRPFGHP